MTARTLLIALVLFACERDKASAPHERCFADEIGTIKAEWSVIDECATERDTCRRDCLHGDADACLNLAFATQGNADDNTRDLAIELDYFARACKGGLALACTNWAATRRYAPDPPPMSCLYRVFDKACAAGDAFGCSMTARILIEFPRTAFDPWIGYNQLVNACDRYLGPPCRFLALYIERGEFGVPDGERIKVLLQRACDGDDEDACGHTSAEETMR